MANFNIEEIIDPNHTPKENIGQLKEAVKKNEKEINALQASINSNCVLSDQTDHFSSGQEPNRSNGLKSNTTAKVNQTDVSMQVELLSYCNCLEDLEVFMPKKDDPNYENIINAMLFEIRRQLVAKELEIRQDQFNHAPILEEKTKALVKLEKMQDFLYDYMEDQIMETQEETIEMPKLFYTTTPAGNICLLNDLKEIPRENYDDFLTLFASVHMGKLRRIKTIDRSGKKFQNSFCQVRLNYARMTLHIMKNNCIVLSSAFLKHAQRSSIFSNRFKSIDANYSRQKDYIEKHIEDPQFIEKQEQVTSQVYKLLRKER